VKWTILDLLLFGAPHEVAPADKEWVDRQAERWANSTLLTDMERARIRLVWINGERQPAFNVGNARRDELNAIGSQP
jgi:hypothetical protein